ncbi:Vacuolar sorting protein VPS33/slp1 (Sec1 family) [Phaffia rhodozyma]|uniref:Vacuolar sorting protein VPS33/slp1 (Sec1 family) n=1 Tax=Phaffia rhodozyma TaxID=264483 RepID=A0A0F7SHA6_PHARH|nr:Vacuolar sorting protein VPS33/slp1 (Sec1 family) [Phaffia rhodozyma]
MSSIADSSLQTSLKEVDSPLDTSFLSTLAKDNLVQALNAINGAKTLVLDPTLAGPLGLVTEVSLLKHQAVDKMFWLEKGPLTAPTKNIIWMCRPKISWMKTIANQIRSHNLSASSHTYTILLVPRKTELCRQILEEEGVLGDVKLEEYNLSFIPLENDVLSLELEHAAKEIFLDKDETSVFYSAQALHLLQKTYGIIPRIIGKGDVSKRLSRQLQTLRRTDSSSTGPVPLTLSTQIDSLILLDRSADWVTPMCTQLTYEGLVDETMGIKNAHVEVSPSLLNNQPSTVASTSTTETTPSLSQSTPATSGKKKKVALNSKDKVFSEIRDLNFAIVGNRLNAMAKRIAGAYNQGRHGKDIAQMRDFVGKLSGLQGEHQALKLHTGLTEEIMAITKTDEFLKPLEISQNILAGYELTNQLSAIEDLINQGLPFNTILRLLILMAVTSGPLKGKVYDNLRREILQVYGYEKLPLLLSLASLGLFPKTPASSPPKSLFPTIRKSLRLLVDDLDENNPADISFVYSGYAPLSIRLVQCVAQKNAVLSTPVVADDRAVGGSSNGEDGEETFLPKAHPIVGWKGFEDVVAYVPGATFDEIQSADLHQPVQRRSPKEQTTTTIVFFLGGCTFTEIAALRKMAGSSKGRQFLICTTSIISGNSLLDSIAGDEPRPLEPADV